MKDLDLRNELIRTVLKMNELGINQGTSGNAAVRMDDGYLITPSGMAYEDIRPEDVVYKRIDGDYESPNGLRKPSVNGGFTKIYLSRETMSKRSYMRMARPL